MIRAGESGALPIVAGLIERGQASLATLRRDIRTKSGSALLDFIATDIAELKRVIFDPDGLQVIRTAIDASRWINEQMEAWLGETNAVDTLTQSAPNNVTSAMGLALLDVADVARGHALAAQVGGQPLGIEAVTGGRLFGMADGADDDLVGLGESFGVILLEHGAARRGRAPWPPGR